MFVQRVASLLVIFCGAAMLRAAVDRASWTLLALGLAVAVVGVTWLVLGGAARPPQTDAPAGAISNSRAAAALDAEPASR